MAAENKVFIDLTNYRENVSSRVQPGDYLVIVDHAEYDKARSGAMMITLWYRILNGEFEGAEIIDRLVQTERAMFRTVGFMQAIGMPTPKKKLQINLSQFIGKKLVVTLDDGEPYNGRISSEVRGYMRPEMAKKTGQDEPGAPDDLPADEGPAEDVDLEKVDLG